MEKHDLLISINMDGFRATFEPIPWSPIGWSKTPTEYLVVEADRDENDNALNMDVWESIAQEEVL